MQALKPAALAALTLLAMGCATTMIKTAWHNPEAKQPAYTKVLALAIADQSSNRRVMEDALTVEVAMHGQVRTVPAYTVLPDADIKDEAKIRAAIAKAGADGLVVMRMVSTEKERTYVPGQVYSAPVVYRSWSGYYRVVMPMSYSPSYYRTDEKVRLETMVFTVKDEMLVWAGMSETSNPASITALTQEVAGAVAKDMQKRGLIH